MPLNLRSHDVFQWPETRAFLGRLGVDLTLPIRSVTVVLQITGAPMVRVEHVGVNRPTTEERELLESRAE